MKKDGGPLKEHSGICHYFDMILLNLLQHQPDTTAHMVGEVDVIVDPPPKHFLVGLA